MIGYMPRQKEPKTVFGKRLLTARHAKGMTQIQLAKAIGSTQRAISYYEAEGGSPAMHVVTKLASELGTTTDELLGIAPTHVEQPELETAAERRLWKRFRQLLNLPEKDRRAVMRMLDSLSKTASGA